MRRIAGIAALLSSLWAAAGQAQTGSATFTLEPAMSKGPGSGPVTIVEFSDYQ